MKMKDRKFSVVPWLKKLKKRELSTPDYDLDDYEEDADIYGESIYCDSTDEIIFEEGKDAINQDDVNLMDIYWVKYRKINVFFMVSKLKSHSVALYELETKVNKLIGEDDKYYETICEGFKPRKRPYIITNNNCWSKTEFWVKSDKDGCIYLEISPDSPLCKLDEARGRAPILTIQKIKRLDKEKLIEEFKCLTNIPFPYEEKADWLSEKELIEARQESKTLARA